MIQRENPMTSMILDAVDLAIIVLEVGDDGLARYVEMNKKARSVAKMSKEDYFGKTALEVYGGSTGKRALAMHADVARSGKEFTYDIVLPTELQSRCLRTTLTPIFDSAGTLTHLVGASADVTSERERDMALELTRMAKEKAEEASLAKERFLANMSHEIRTPMNGIIGMCEMLAETPLDDQQELFASTISNSANALLEIINDVLDFSKIQAEKVSLHNEAFSLRNLVQETATLLSAKAAYKGLELHVGYDDVTPAEFLGDASKIRQVLLNLLGNAIKFTDSGSISVGVSYDEKAPQYPLHLWVKDTGHGIEEAQKDSIFSAFQQVESPETNWAEGTGLGLAITKALVERMGGVITVESRVKVGSTFKVMLPLERLNTPSDALEEVGGDQVSPPIQPYFTQEAEPQPDTSQVRSAKAAVGVPDQYENALSGKKLLIAEDNKTNRLVVEKMLAKSGANLCFASNGRLAVEAFREANFDLVLMDLSMPVMGGLEATREIRRYEKETQRSECPIFALTANAQASDAEACLDAGMNDFITKPFRKKDLFSRLTCTKQPRAEEVDVSEV